MKTKYLIVAVLLLVMVGIGNAAVLITSQFGALAQNASGYVDGNPIGGGKGYSSIYTEENASVTNISINAVQLVDALRTATSGNVIFIRNTSSVNMTGVYNISIPAGVTIASDRGYNGSVGGLIFRHRLSTDPSNSTFIPQSMFTIPEGHNNVHITGLRLEGVNPTTTGVGGQTKLAYGIFIHDAKGIVIDNNEIYAWDGSGVEQDNWDPATTVGWDTSAEIGSTILNVHHNYIHNDQADLGYGVSIASNGAALVKANLFDKTRHAIESEGYTNSGYEASYNIHLGKSTDNFIDVHGYTWAGGRAGTLFRVHHNDINIGYPGELHQPWSVAVRAVPELGMTVNWNRVYNSTGWGVQQSPGDFPITQYNAHGTGNMTVTDNIVNNTYYHFTNVNYGHRMNTTLGYSICPQTDENDFSCGGYT